MDVVVNLPVKGRQDISASYHGEVVWAIGVLRNRELKYTYFSLKLLNG